MGYYAKNPWEQPENPRCPTCGEQMIDNGKRGLRRGWVCDNQDCENRTSDRLSSASELSRPSRKQTIELLRRLKQLEDSTQQTKDIVARNEAHDRKNYPDPYKG